LSAPTTAPSQGLVERFVAAPITVSMPIALRRARFPPFSPPATPKRASRHGKPGGLSFSAFLHFLHYNFPHPVRRAFRSRLSDLLLSQA